MKRPFVCINCAMSTDGKISSLERKQVHISGPEDMDRVKQLRADSDAIMVGIGTVLADDPGLRIKSPPHRKMRSNRGLPEDPIRVVVDSKARTPLDAEVLGNGCLIAVSQVAPEERLQRLSDKCEIFVSGNERVDLAELLQFLYNSGVMRLLVEGGATLNYSLIKAGLVDEISVFIGPMIIGGENAPTLVDGAGFKKDYPTFQLISLETLDGGALLKWRVLR